MCHAALSSDTKSAKELHKAFGVHIASFPKYIDIHVLIEKYKKRGITLQKHLTRLNRSSNRTTALDAIDAPLSKTHEAVRW